MSFVTDPTGFVGAKVMLFIGDKVVALLRDDFAHIAWPDHWDFPGGMRDPGETAAETVVRETLEELNLKITPTDLIWRRDYIHDRTGLPEVFFAAHLSAMREEELVLGDEGQAFALMTPEEFINHPKAIPNFAERLRVYIAERKAV